MKFARRVFHFLLSFGVAMPCFGQTLPMRVHDPRVINSGGWFYLFSTGTGIPMWRSHDMIGWESGGAVFDRPPAWAVDDFPRGNYLWAPDVVYFGGQFHLYFAASHFGKNDSAIGLVTNATLDRGNASYQWKDQGIVVRTHAGDDWNAIDPAVFIDQDAVTKSETPWLVAGSFWSGIKLLRLDRQTGLLANDPPIALARRHSPDALEAGCIFRHGDDYYLLVSFDYCCRGVSSTYRLMVGRSHTITGPYLDFDRRPMLEGGGTLVLAGYGQVRGPGHAGVFTVGDRQLLVHHFYDADDNGRSEPQVRPLFWSADGWPLAGEPFALPTQPATRPAVTAADIAGKWMYSLDYSDPFAVTLLADGSTQPDIGRWSLNGQSVRFTINARHALHPTVDCFLSEDGKHFIGRNGEGAILRGECIVK